VKSDKKKIIAQIQGCELFHTAPENLLEKLACVVASKKLAAGKTLFREKDPSFHMYIVVEGSAKVLRKTPKGDVMVSEVLPGETLGEMGLLDHVPRSAEVIAGHDGMRLLELHRDNFEECIRHDPLIVQAVIRLLSERLRTSTCQQEMQFIKLNQLEEFNNQQARELEIAETLAHTDWLTGVYNRRHFLKLSGEELVSEKTDSPSLCALMLDADHFKKINDTHGHAVGDAVLKHIVKICLDTLRRNDFIGRLGGEEFAIILPETTLLGGMAAAEKLRQAIESSPLAAGDKMISSTVSIGLATLEKTDQTIEAVLDRADKALYQAKKEGRNKVNAWNSAL